MAPGGFFYRRGDIFGNTLAPITSGSSIRRVSSAAFSFRSAPGVIPVKNESVFGLGGYEIQLQTDRAA